MSRMFKVSSTIGDKALKRVPFKVLMKLVTSIVSNTVFFSLKIISSILLESDDLVAIFVTMCSIVLGIVGILKGEEGHSHWYNWALYFVRLGLWEKRNK